MKPNNKNGKMTISMYECGKCNKSVYFRSNDEIYTKCKTCGQEMKYCWTQPYNPEKNIKQANSMNNNTSIVTPKQTKSINIPKCPICQSTDLSKISTLKKATKIGLFGIFGAGDIGKTYKCNNCGSKF